MPTKQIRITMQAQPNGVQDVLLSVAVDGAVKFNQRVPAVGPAQQGITNPNEIVEFNLDVPSSANVGDTQTYSFAIQSIDGTSKIETISCNFFADFEIEKQEPIGNVLIPIAGSANVFTVCNITSQPLWNGEALLERYNIALNLGPEQITGPGEVLIEAGETATFDVAVLCYNDSLPS